MTQAIDHPSACDTIVVVPCFNEAKRLDIAAFDGFLTRFADIALLFVDDGSKDDTPHLLERLRKQRPRQVYTLRLGSNVGKAEAVRRGVQLALRRRPAMVGYWDADLATPLETIPRFQTVLQSRPELALVMGSRVALLGRQIRRRWRRHVLGRVFATAASLVLGLPVYDTQCGAKLFRVTYGTAAVFRWPFGSRWIFDIEILARMTAIDRSGAGRGAAESIYEYPLEQWHDVAGSRLRLLDFPLAALELAAILWRYRLRPGRSKAISTDFEISAANEPAPSARRDAA